MTLIHLKKKQLVALFVNVRDQPATAVIDQRRGFNAVRPAGRTQLFEISKSF
jgi:hypothetical protein